MRDLVVLLIHFISTLVRLLGPGGARSIVAKSLLLKHNSWSTNTAVAGLFKNLREYVEGQESAARTGAPATSPSALQPVAAKSEQH